MGWSFVAAQQVRLIGLAGADAPVALGLNAAALYVGAVIGSLVGAGVLSGAGAGWLGPVGGGLAVLALVHLRVSVRVSG
ncbi:MAG: hypothetical protein ACU0CO_00315 [Shimia sp.]